MARTKRPHYVQFTVTLNKEQHQALKRLDRNIGAGLTAHVRIALNRYIIAEWAKRRELERAAARGCTTRSADGGTLNPKPRFNWRRIDPLLLLACLAPEPKKRERLLSRLVQRFGMARQTLLRRLDFLGARFVPTLLGPGALEAYERDMLLAIEGEKLYCVMRNMLMNNVQRLRQNGRPVLSDR